MIGTCEGYKLGETRVVWICPNCGRDWCQWGSDHSGLCRICGNDPRQHPNIPQTEMVQLQQDSKNYRWVKVS